MIDMFGVIKKKKLAKHLCRKSMNRVKRKEN